jgi:hypothetical protein
MSSQPKPTRRKRGDTTGEQQRASGVAGAQTGNDTSPTPEDEPTEEETGIRAQLDAHAFRLRDVADESGPWLLDDYRSDLVTAAEALRTVASVDLAGLSPERRIAILRRGSDIAERLEALTRRLRGPRPNPFKRMYMPLSPDVRQWRFDWREFRALLDAASALLQRVRDEAGVTPSSGGGANRGSEVQQPLHDADDEVERLRERLAEIEAVAESLRPEAGVQASRELGAIFEAEARWHSVSRERWLRFLVVALIFAAVLGWIVIFFTHPKSHATNGEIVSALAVEVLVVGLLLYGVRIASMQFRAHRHLEAIARNKAAALRTFSQMIVVASEPEIRSQIATILASSVFASADSGVQDTSEDQVTLPERVAAAVTSRLAR